MTREEAIIVIRKMLAYTDLSVRANLNADMVNACNMAIKALEQELCEDAISRKEAILQIQRYGVGTFDSDDFIPEVAERYVIGLLKKLPSVQPKREHGEWKKEMVEIIEDGYIGYEPKWTCVKCGQTYDGGIANSIIKYCYNCGADMRGDNNADSN